MPASFSALPLQSRWRGRAGKASPRGDQTIAPSGIGGIYTHGDARPRPRVNNRGTVVVRDPQNGRPIGTPALSPQRNQPVLGESEENTLLGKALVRSGRTAHPM